MADIIVGVVLVILVGAAIAYIIREKKRGVACIGCPAAGTCGAKKHPGSAGCSSCAALEESLDEIREAVHGGK
ncbi:MAG: hypothetical protein IKV72_02765 [Firmicutes bacterium]|nr:hypothetical protein [Bacillota bacterium]MBR5488601.1 hypothetical protein [Bacillota bacterium]